MAKKGFAIFRRNFGGKIDDLYYKNWENARMAFDHQLGMLVDDGVRITSTEINDDTKRKKDRVCKCAGVNTKGLMFTMELLNGHFSE